MFATTFSTPKFSVLHGPAIAAPESSASICEYDNYSQDKSINYVC